MSAAAMNPAAAVGMDASTRSRMRWPIFRRALHEAHESQLVHAVRIHPDGYLDIILKHEKKSREKQPSSVTTPAPNGEQPPKLSRRKQKSRERAAKFHQEFPHGKAAARASLPPQAAALSTAPITNSETVPTGSADTLNPFANYATVTSTNVTALFHDKDFLLCNRAMDSVRMPPPPPRQPKAPQRNSAQAQSLTTQKQMRDPRAQHEVMQCEALSEHDNEHAREGQDASSAKVPPLGPSKREAALAGAHKSPTKSDGVVHKKTRATYPP